MNQGTRPVFRRMGEPGGEAPMGDTITITNEQLQMLIEGAAKSAQAGMTAEDLAKAFAATQKRENPHAPMVSVYNPRGETEHPKPRLRAKTMQNGIELDQDTLTWEEIEALNALPPGDFRVAKANGVKIPFAVQFTRGMDEDTIERVDIHYPCKDEHRHDHRALVDYCLDVLESAGKTEDVERLTALRKELDGLRRKSA